MIKYAFTVVLLWLICNQNPKINEYTYRSRECIGLQSPMDIYYQDMKIGELKGIKAENKCCYGKLKFNKDFKLVKSMRLYKITPLISNSYIKIEDYNMNCKKIKISFKDTIDILEPKK